MKRFRLTNERSSVRTPLPIFLTFAPSNLIHFCALGRILVWKQVSEL